MLRLRLFQRDDPTNQIESRTLDEGEVSIGRDAKAGWTVNDPERGISRQHLVVASRGGLLTVRDTSSNGVFMGTPRQRIERDRPIPVARGEAIQFGGYLLVIEEEARALASPESAASPSPFGGTAGLEPTREAPRPRPQQPFASALKPDPLARGGEVGSSDAWENRPDAPAGSWDPVAPHRKPDHGNLIGSERNWQAPPPPPAREAGYGFDAPFSRPILEQPVVAPGSAGIPSDWMEASQAETPPVLAAEPPPPMPDPAVAADPILPPRPPERDTAAEEPLRTAAPATEPSVMPDATMLFEHFCAGAGLQPTAFAGEDKARVMERLGAVYRQAVLGVADLMQERTALRNEYRMVHTTVRPEGNNPFKWVPPQRIAVELLRGEGGGYTTGERALNEALHDVKAHLLCMLAGMRAALGATFKALAPEEVEAKLAGRNYLIKTQRDAALWAEYVELATRLRAEADDSADGLINRAFRQAYEAQAAELGTGRQWR